MTFDPTAGGNSYVTVEWADTYATTSFHGKAKWEAVVDKEAALVSASSILDWFTTWNGTKLDSTQTLHFPTSGFTATDGTEIASGIIPDLVKTATVELAISNIDVDRTADDDLAGISSLTAGPLNIKSTGSGSSSTDISVVPEYVSKITKTLVQGYSSNVTRLYRG